MKHKLLLLGLMLISVYSAKAQEIKTYSSCDTNTDDDITISDVTNTANKVLGKAAAEKQVVTAEDLNSVLIDIYSKLESQTEEIRILKSCISSIAEKVGAKTPEQIEEEEKYNGHEYVDLGLSVKWATCNVGASSPEEYGNYFAWGETTGYDEGKTTFSWSTYTLCNGTETTMTKYCTSSPYGTVDNNTVLEASDDAATVNWGESWRMPTYDEQAELRTGCYCEWTSDYNSTGKAGYIVYKVKYDSDKGVKKYSDGSYSATVTGSYSLNDTHIFLPAAGCTLGDTGSYGYYWSSSLYFKNSYVACYLDFDLSNFGFGYLSRRYCGYSVRPVCQ